MKLSVIIPAYNESQTITAAINALKNQSFPRSEFEIIVVDNNSNDNTAEIAAIVGADKIVNEAKRGTNIARQRGFQESIGEIVAFLDADSTPPPNWLALIRQYLSIDGVAAVSGPFDYGFRGWKRIAAGLYTHYVFRYMDRILFFIFRRKAGVIIGGNFAASRSAIQQIGGLPPLRFHGDDAAVAILISRMAGKVIFTPELTILSSARRFEKEGLVRVTLEYAWSYFKVYFTKLNILSTTKDSEVDLVVGTMMRPN